MTKRFDYPSVAPKHEIRVSCIDHHNRKEQEPYNLFDEPVPHTFNYKDGQTVHILLTAKEVELRRVCCGCFAEYRLGGYLTAIILTPCSAPATAPVKNCFAEGCVVFGRMAVESVIARVLCWRTHCIVTKSGQRIHCIAREQCGSCR